VWRQPHDDIQSNKLKTIIMSVLKVSAYITGLAVILTIMSISTFITAVILCVYVLPVYTISRTNISYQY
jgi:hypothetical protein